jgi:dimethylglycine dehydrogenase
MAMVRPEFAALGAEVHIRVLGEDRRAVVIADSPYDPKNEALRS